MTHRPAVSVVLPTYNHLRFLPDAVADIARQTFADWELIVVNDGSTDGTADWLATLADPRVRVLHQANAGPHAALNAGVRAARSDLVTWVSADNRSLPFFLDALHAAIAAEPHAALACSPHYLIDEADRVLGLNADNAPLLRELVTGTPRGLAGFLYRRHVHDTVGWYDGFACDTRMWARVMEHFPAVFVTEPTMLYRVHRDCASMRERPRIERERAAITADFLARHGGRVDASLLRRLYPGLNHAPEYAGDAAADFASRLCRGGAPEPGLALALAATAAATSPQLPLRPLAASVACALHLGRDPLAEIWPVLAASTALSPRQRDAALGLAASFTDIGAAAPCLLEATHPLFGMERQRVFSYAAWKVGSALLPVPALR